MKVLVTSQYLITDPPTRNIVDSFVTMGYEVLYVQQSTKQSIYSQEFSFEFIEVPTFQYFKLKILDKIFNYFYFKIVLNRLIRRFSPKVVVAVMYLPISLINISNRFKYVASILDIPDELYVGRLDRLIHRKAFKQLNKWSDIIASDEYKSDLVRSRANLQFKPQVVYNCPAKNYFEGYHKLESRKWLINKLTNSNCRAKDDSFIVLRAGAIGKYCGIEETLHSMLSLPDSVLFVMIGRPEYSYKVLIKELIDDLGLSNRVLLVDQPSDVDWKKYLLAADLGHMIHTKAINDDAYNNMFELNSSLSNNRLYQYMAAGLPILSYNDSRLCKIHNDVNAFLVVDLSNIQTSLTENINEIYHNRVRREQLSINSKKAFLSQYNWESQFKPLLDRIETYKN